MSHVFHELARLIDRLGPHQWEMILAAMVIVGIVCLRGFGSRSNY